MRGIVGMGEAIVFMRMWLGIVVWWRVFVLVVDVFRECCWGWGAIGVRESRLVIF
jgi:hypothetical protein